MAPARSRSSLELPRPRECLWNEPVFHPGCQGAEGERELRERSGAPVPGLNSRSWGQRSQFPAPSSSPAPVPPSLLGPGSGRAPKGLPEIRSVGKTGIWGFLIPGLRCGDVYRHIPRGSREIREGEALEAAAEGGSSPLAPQGMDLQDFGKPGPSPT